MSASEILENWKAAGLISGAAFADEMQKLAFLRYVDECVKEGMDKEALHPLLHRAARILKSPAARGIGTAGAAAGAGAGGVVLGKRHERTKAEEEMQQLAPHIFRAGFIQGARAGFSQGARAGYIQAKGERA